MSVLVTVFWFLVTLGILIPIHEYGHYRVARACGVKVLRFSIGFGNVVWSRRFGPDRTEFALSMDLGSLRASAGLGLSWTSPVGPFKLSYGLPVRAEQNDRIQRFQFQVGTAF